VSKLDRSDGLPPVGASPYIGQVPHSLIGHAHVRIIDHSWPCADGPGMEFLLRLLTGTATASGGVQLVRERLALGRELPFDPADLNVRSDV
jgi:hypothetical protein